MCGRFTQRYTWREVHELYDLIGVARNLQAHYNIAPTDTVEVVRSIEGGATELVPMRWGLIPWWWKKPLKQLPATFTRRAEGVESKPMFCDAFKRHARAIRHPRRRPHRYPDGFARNRDRIDDAGEFVDRFHEANQIGRTGWVEPRQALRS